MMETLAWTSDSKEFGKCTTEDEYYRGCKSDEKSLDMAETYYWTFFNVEANLHGYVYMMMKPNFGVGTCGVFAHIGSKREYLAAEFFDFRTFMPDDFVDDKGNIRAPNGLRVDFIEPMKTMRIRFENAKRGFSLDMVQEAVQPAVMRSNNKHFEQTMRVAGKVTMDGRTYDIDHLAVRDRSWGERRPEDGHVMPPYTWMTGAHSDYFAFTIAALDDPKLKPNWVGLYQVEPGHILKDAWLYDNGKLVKFANVSKLTERGHDGLMPARSLIDCTTSDGIDYRFVGEVTANLPWKTWQNAMCHVGLTRWTSPQLDGVFWGITAEVQWNHFIANVCTPL